MTTRRDLRACSHALRPLVEVAVDVAVAVVATGKMAAKVAEASAVAVMARVAVVVVETATAAKAAEAANAVVVTARVTVVVAAAPEPVVVKVVATEPERRPLTRLDEVANPDRTGSKASLVRKLTPWISKTELEEVAVLTARTATAEADGEVTKSHPPTTSR